MANPDTDWVEPEAADVQTVMSQLVLNAAEAQATKNDTNTQRADENLRMTIARIRHAVFRSGNCPLSATPNTVPPEAEQHALVMTAKAMTASTSNLGAVVLTMNGGVYSPFGDLVKSAEKWMSDVLKGDVLPTRPTDPQQAGDGDELVPDGAQYAGGTGGACTVTGLVVGKIYVYVPGPNEASLACGPLTLSAGGSFAAQAQTATLTAGAGAGIVFVTASVQRAVDAVNSVKGGEIVGAVDMSSN